MRTILALGSLAAVLMVLVSIVGPGCSSGHDPENELIVYCGRTKALVAPILEEFERETGIRLSVSYNRTQDLANLIAAEGDQTPADLFFAQDSGHLGALAAEGLLQPLPQKILDRVATSFRDGEGRWIGTSGRARCLVYDPSRISADELPKRLEDLTDSKWKGRLGWAPSNGSFLAHLSFLRHRWGDEKLRGWLRGMKANEPRRFKKNSPQVKAVAEGRIDLGWVNHYYLHRAKKQNPKISAANWHFEDGDPGNLLMVAGVGIVTKDAKRRELAERLVEFLVSKRAQEFFAGGDHEYPVANEVPASSEIPALDQLGLSEIDQSQLIELGRVDAILNDLNIR